MFKRITIIGLGLIGGSLGLAIKEGRIVKEVVGVCRRRSTIRQALSIGVVDSATRDIKKGIIGSELIVLATPVLESVDVVRVIAGLLQKGTIVTDVGSTKEDIVKKIERILPEGVNFVGAHPLAGSEKSGISYADKDLFKCAYCVLTMTKRTNREALKKVERLWKKLGLKTEIMCPGMHDRVVSKLSHLPHAVAVGISNTCSKVDLRLAARGFRDTTRIASGGPRLWKDIFITNRANIAKDIRILKKELSRIERALENNDPVRLLNLFKRAKSLRDSL